MKELKRPNNPFLSYPLNSEEQHKCIKYANNLLEYADQIESGRNKCRDSVTKLLDVNEKVLQELQTLKEAVKIYKSGRYPSLAMLDKLKELIK